MSHAKELNDVKRDFTIQIEELQETIGQMSTVISRLKSDMKNKCKDLVDAVLERDVRIQELEDQNENLEMRINNLQSPYSEFIEMSEYNQVITVNSALKSNLKAQSSRLAELEASNKNLTMKGKLC